MSASTPKHTPIDDNIMEKFLDLECALSPENLHCDGEYQNYKARRKYVSLVKEWKALEKTIGREVTSEEIWQWHDLKNTKKKTPK